MKNNKVICHLFFDEFPKDSRIRRYVNALSEDKFRLIIISLGNGVLPKHEFKDDLTIYRINIKKKRGSFLRRIYEYIIFEISAFIYTTFVFYKYKPTIFHIHTLPDFLVLSAFIPKIYGSKIILDYHELFPEAILQFKKGLKKGDFLYKLILLQEKVSFLFSDYIIAFHHPAKEILESRYGKKKYIEVIMNGVDEYEMPEFVKKKAEKFRIVYNGTINYNLNLTLVLKALKVLRNSNKEIFNNIEFNLYGDGPDLENIMNFAKENNLLNIYYKGRLNFFDMMKELETASVCILPPVKDIYSDLFYSLKLIEMIYLNIPVIATRLNTYVRYYPEDCLFYFESENQTDLAEKIKYVYLNPEKIESYTKKAYTEYQKYSWKIMKKRYLTLINSISTNE